MVNNNLDDLSWSICEAFWYFRLIIVLISYTIERGDGASLISLSLPPFRRVWKVRSTSDITIPSNPEIPRPPAGKTNICDIRET